MLKPDEKLKIRNREWEIDCPDMHLRSRGKDRESFSGPGLIRIGEDGAITFKLYTKGEPRDDILTADYGDAGVLIPDTRYFDLQATDFDGRLWTATRLLPERNQNWSTSSVIWTGKLPSLVHKSDVRVEFPSAALLLEYFGDVEIPCNERIESEKAIGGVTTSRSWAMRAAKFDVSGYDFFLEQQEGRLLVKVTCPGATIPNHLHLRVTEALQFVLARWLSWSVIERLEGTRYEVEVRPAGTEKGSARLQRPIASQQVDFENNTWKLFAAYFKHVLTDASPNPHRLSELVYSAIEGSKGSVPAMALSLSVAIEGVVRHAFSALCQPSAGFTKAVAKAVELIEKGEIEDSARRRIRGAIEGMKGLRAQQGLERLAELGLVTNDELSAWKKLRHRSAHAHLGDLSDRGAIQRFFDWSLRLTVLLYRLIFTAIGYAGPYTDYGTHGWPLRKHQCTSVDDQGASVGAESN